jgi:quercetin dioxygenase-like cupin family protein
VSILVRRIENPGALVALSDSRQLKSGYVLLESGIEVGQHRTQAGEELIVVMEGTAEVVCGEERRTVPAPAVVLIPARALHNVKNESGDLLKYVYVVVSDQSQWGQAAPPQTEQ